MGMNSFDAITKTIMDKPRMSRPRKSRLKRSHANTNMAFDNIMSRSYGSSMAVAA